MAMAIIRMELQEQGLIHWIMFTLVFTMLILAVYIIRVLAHIYGHLPSLAVAPIGWALGLRL